MLVYIYLYIWILYRRSVKGLIYIYIYIIYIYIYKECRSVLVKLHPITIFVFFGLPIVSCSMINNLILGCLWPLVFVLSNILTLGIWRSAISHPHDVLPLSVLSEYRIQHGAIGPFYVTSTYSTWKFCRRVSGLATDRPCRVWCRGLTTCPYMFVHFLEIDF